MGAVQAQEPADHQREAGVCVKSWRACRAVALVSLAVQLLDYLFYWVLGAPWNPLARFTTRWVEGALLTAGLMATAYIAFDTEAGGAGLAEPRFYAPVPFLFWAAIRFDMCQSSPVSAQRLSATLAHARMGLMRMAHRRAAAPQHLPGR
jgi:hypothetical protein